MPTFDSEDPGSQENLVVAPLDNASGTTEGVGGEKQKEQKGQAQNIPADARGDAPTSETKNSARETSKSTSVICLIISCILSVSLVCVVAILIALMQFQGRLLLAQPKLTAGRLVYFVNLEKRLNDVNISLEKNAKILEREGLNLSKNQTELTFRINRLCAAFTMLPQNQQYVSRCESFLSRIPFDFVPQQFDAMQKALNYDVNSFDGNEQTASMLELDKDALEKIEAKFSSYMGDPLIQGQKFSEFEYLYGSDISAIAFLNQASALRLQPLYAIARAHYLEDCAYRTTLARGVGSYRDVEELNCLGIPSVEQITASALAPTKQITGQNSADGSPMPAPPPPNNTKGTGGPEESARQPSADSRPGDVSGQPTLSGQPLPAEGQVGGGSAKADSTAGDVSGQPTLSGQPFPAEGQVGGGSANALSISAAGNNGSLQTDNDTISAEQQRVFDLVSSYRFYDNISQTILENLIMSPGEFLALLLVCFGGVLGAFLKIIFSTYISSMDPDFRDLIVGPILGLICALVLYILLRAGFIAITDHAEQAGSTNLSPFVIVFVSLTAGLLSARAVAVLQRSSATLLGAADPTEVDRWAVGLKDALFRRGISSEQLAARLRLLPKVVQDWIDEVEAVPVQQQRDLSLILDTSPRMLFTDLPPS